MILTRYYNIVAIITDYSANILYYKLCNLTVCDNIHKG